MTNNNSELKALETRVTKLENFISESLDQLIDNKIQNTEGYLKEKISEVHSRLNSDIDDVRGYVPDTYDLESDIESVECDLSNLDRRIDDVERRLSDLE